MNETVNSASEWELVAENIMFALIRKNEVFSGDSFYSMAVKESMPPGLIKQFSGSMFKRFQHAGYIQKRSDYKISRRNGGAVMPMWEKSEGV